VISKYIITSAQKRRTRRSSQSPKRPALAELIVMLRELRINRRVRVFLSLLIVVFLCGPVGASAADDNVSNKPGASIVSKNMAHMNANSSIRDVVNHPSFKGFGQFILPLDRGTYDGNMQLNRVGSLLPYHSQIEPEAVVKTVNYMIDQVADGKTIFYTFYTESVGNSPHTPVTNSPMPAVV
jgi:hypothetical protein